MTTPQSNRERADIVREAWLRFADRQYGRHKVIEHEQSGYKFYVEERSQFTSAANWIAEVSEARGAGREREKLNKPSSREGLLEIQVALSEAEFRILKAENECLRAIVEAAKTDITNLKKQSPTEFWMVVNHLGSLQDWKSLDRVEAVKRALAWNGRVVRMRECYSEDKATPNFDAALAALEGKDG